VFLGTYSPRLDDKGRIAFPAKYRDELAGGVVITKGQEHCLYVFPREDFAVRFAGLSSAPVGSRKVREALRMLAAGAHDDAPDKQGRVIIPAHLRQYAGLGRDVVVVGAMSRLEIWDTQAWTSYQSAKEADFADLDEEVLADLF
jgi:MraZ protein